jgi:hypothetical protein
MVKTYIYLSKYHVYHRENVHRMYNVQLFKFKKHLLGQEQWLILVIPATWEAEIRRITVRGKKLMRPHLSQ